MPRILSSKFQSHTIKSYDFPINPINLFHPNSMQGGGSENFELITGMSYDFPNMISSEFWSNGIKIEDLKINPINPFTPINTKEGSENLKCITRNIS